MENKYVLLDKSTECLSAIHTSTITQYLNLIEGVYENQGGIDGQRAPLKTKTGIRIRSRMVSDISNGAILPPMVIGIVLDGDEFERIQSITTDEEMSKFINSIDKSRISIIDGMQRTTAMHEAIRKNSGINNNPVRVEIWLSKTVEKLIYRMLVLNTGQVPWDMKRQLQTIYKPILTEIIRDVPSVEVLLIDDNSRRTNAGQLQSSKVIEYFLAFSSRKANVDIKERVAEDFARMDATEATANEYFLNNFKSSLHILATLDQAFERSEESPINDFRFRSGRDIFKSSPACLGFTAAVAVNIYGPPGFNYDPIESCTKMADISQDMNIFIQSLNNKSARELNDFLDLITLNEKLSRKSQKVGEYEREFFYKAFSVLLSESNRLTSMEPCWSVM